MSVLICHSTAGWIPLKLSYQALTAAVSNINEIKIFFKMIHIFQFTNYYRFFAVGYALQSGTVFSSRVLIFYKLFLAIWITLWACIWHCTLICFLCIEEIVTLPKRIVHWKSLLGVKELSFQVRNQPGSREGNENNYPQICWYCP